MFHQPFYLQVNTVFNVLTKQFLHGQGCFNIRGASEILPIKLHQIILKDILDNEHALEINVNSGESSEFQIKNDSNILTSPKAEFSLKHPGIQKKRFKPGEILKSPLVHTFIWKALDLDHQPVVVTLSLIPLPEKHGVQIYYTIESTSTP